MSDSNHVHRVALVGASGHIGQHIAEELVKKNIAVTALTRPDSSSTFPSTLTVAKVSNDDHAGLVKVLTGQDVLIITLGVTAPQDTQPKLIRAAAEAGVKFIIPNEWVSLLPPYPPTGDWPRACK
jgi:putative NADH-flavin reductase